ncbi:CDP-diacylglycerol--glycerol-3-phosphate 3-phosphatidyltransferase [Pseudohongiella sp. SYSU M77423]|uniref:CDP-diacylglycerol--glycerol-3-phosphate 3-phosphatidyltransferase n=1 Tax=unclassified Pseudohongiella TaxID=2629611 RepID=UPI000C928868|nr:MULTISPECIES: CDP-diacylglycerol--glycerol-3-phosphate 3-phosphatidyltransferase [unclassified Pseudohongiella]MAO39033.1 CDP-diacylglycerol--glycerol-3-phosphate 3-phosphatidyltransferase [Pseudohongiella sp.]MAY56183.1 CDP-diacylglycerol--glycerol-3-phosphate 3-phosphatidyltransferase [Gammaproteobacteria bacterium]MDH7944991.1 CDP-diacylglycerol--glycerol-3-phosphate 3-phosphatidyltransferase [Pseudohongiella sp. SYSU M77423]MEC8858444.1 CDP-diacylglycerol--glycerol-3-phosphate 3-phosphat|tara:strand:- start:1421 stop:1966 length:546 start_codon:yes stop_codon:yes gene_type:complete
MNAANLVTMSRVLLVPVIVMVYYSGQPWSQLAAAVLFTVASLSDWLDGYLARRLNQTSAFGAFLDPVADKLLVVMALVLLTANFPSPWFVLPTAVIIGREVFISALREWMASRNQRDAVAVAYVGKLKTTVQMIAIIVLLAYSPEYPYWLLQIGYGLIYLAAALSLWSMVIYVKNAWPSLK